MIKACQGDVEGEGTLEYLLIYLDDGTAGYIGLERITGRNLFMCPNDCSQHTRQQNPAQLVSYISLPVNFSWRMAAAPSRPPIPIDSTAVLGTNMSAPFSFSPS